MRVDTNWSTNIQCTYMYMTTIIIVRIAMAITIIIISHLFDILEG